MRRNPRRSSAREARRAPSRRVEACLVAARRLRHLRLEPAHRLVRCGSSARACSRRRSSSSRRRRACTSRRRGAASISPLEEEEALLERMVVLLDQTARHVLHDHEVELAGAEVLACIRIFSDAPPTFAAPKPASPIELARLGQVAEVEVAAPIGELRRRARARSRRRRCPRATAPGCGAHTSNQRAGCPSRCEGVRHADARSRAIVVGRELLAAVPRPRA